MDFFQYGEYLCCALAGGLLHFIYTKYGKGKSCSNTENKQ